MDGIFALPYMKNALRLFAKADARGFHERNGGNLTYRLTDEDVRASLPFFKFSGEIPFSAGVSAPAGEYFLTTNAGSYIENIPENPQKELSVLQINEDGRAGILLYGDPGQKITSEFESHLAAHKQKRKAGHRVIYHAHPAHIIALSFILPPDCAAFSNVLWRSIAECVLVYPEGVGVLPFMVPGSREIAAASAEMFARFHILVWAHHGVFATGLDFDDAFSRVDLLEKAAKIYLLTRKDGEKPPFTITDEDLKKACGAFGLQLNEEFLNMPPRKEAKKG